MEQLPKEIQIEISIKMKEIQKMVEEHGFGIQNANITLESLKDKADSLGLNEHGFKTFGANCIFIPPNIRICF